MIRAISAITIALTITAPVNAQQAAASTLDAAIVKLHSNNNGDRDKAYAQLKSDPAALRNPKLKAALLELLDRETRRMVGMPEAGDSVGDIGSEGFAEYFANLSSTVANIGDWDDSHQICILVRGAGVPPSHSSEEAATRERLALPCLREMSTGKSPLDRDTASRVLIELSARAGGALDPVVAQESKQMILNLLHDEDEGVRSETINSLEKFGTEDMIPALKQVAVSDPTMAKTSHNYWLRGRASKAIAAIQKRAQRQ